MQLDQKALRTACDAADKAYMDADHNDGFGDAIFAAIRAYLQAVQPVPVAYTSQAQLDKLAKGKGGTIWSEPLPYHDDIALYAAAISGADNAE